MDDLTGSFSLGSTVLIGDLDTGQQAKIRFPDDRDSLLIHVALTGSGRIAAAAIPSPAAVKKRCGQGCDKVGLACVYLVDDGAVTGCFPAAPPTRIAIASGSI